MTSIELLKNIQEEYDWESAIFFKGDFETIKQDLERLEKLEKVVEIIKNKKVFIQYLLLCIENVADPLNEYNSLNKPLTLTQEEFDLLKEVFKNGK
jgi:hypothetical protein